MWGIERTIGSFSCYQSCDSRWYEYLIPSYAFLPPHPSSWLAKRLEESAGEASDRKGYESRQAEVRGFWEKVDMEDIKTVLDTIDADIKFDIVKALQGEHEANAKATKVDADDEQPVKVGKSIGGKQNDTTGKEEKTEEAAIIINEPALNKVEPEEGNAAHERDKTDAQAPIENSEEIMGQPRTGQLSPEELERQTRLRAATKQLRNAYTTAKRRYRIPKQRIERIQTALSEFVGTANYHNYTVSKPFRDPSAKRHIKSFVVNPKPILIGGRPRKRKDRMAQPKSPWPKLHDAPNPQNDRYGNAPRPLRLFPRHPANVPRQRQIQHPQGTRSRPPTRTTCL